MDWDVVEAKLVDSDILIAPEEFRLATPRLRPQSLT